MGKNFSRIQQFRAALDEAFRKMTCKRKLQKPKVQKNSSNDIYEYSNDIYESYELYETYVDYSLGRTKRRPCTGSNFSKIPIVSEIPKIINPAAWVSSKTQKDLKPQKN